MSHKYDALHTLLHDAFMLKAIEELQEFPSDEEIAKIHEFSPRFIKNMEKMMEECFGNKEKARIVATRNRRIELVKKISAAAAISIAFTFSSAMTVPAIRDSFMKMVVSIVGDDFFNVKIEPTDTVHLFIYDYRAPTFTPEGFKITKIKKLETAYEITYTNDDNHLISYKQHPLSYLSDILIDYQKDESVAVEVEGYNRVFYSLDHQTIILSDADYCYVIQTDLEFEELIKISKSIDTIND